MRDPLDAAGTAGPLALIGLAVWWVIGVVGGWLVTIDPPAMFADTSEAVTVLGAVGTFFTLVVGALGGWYLKIIAKRAELDKQKAELGRQERKDDTAEERKRRKDEIAELYRIIEIKDQDHKDNREQIHELRDQMQGVNMRLAVCEHERAELKKRLDALEAQP